MNRLAEIFESKRREVAEAKAKVPFKEMVDLACASPKPRGFLQALKDSKHPIALIAEVKAASPSQGVIRADFSPEDVALAYREAGADCLSVLTDRPFFGGAPENLARVRSITDVPLLRKDFIDDAYQILEARYWGADACLLIVAALEIGELAELQHFAHEVGLDVLVEIHNQDELDIALTIGCPLIGVNNRNLATFETDLAVSEALIPQIPKDSFAISESALGQHADIQRMQACGARGVLIGTAFCQSPDITLKVQEVMGW